MMRKTVFATLAVLGFSLASTALAPKAYAYTYLFPPHQHEGSSN